MYPVLLENWAPEICFSCCWAASMVNNYILKQMQISLTWRKILIKAFKTAKQKENMLGKKQSLFWWVWILDRWVKSRNSAAPPMEESQLMMACLEGTSPPCNCLKTPQRRGRDIRVWIWLILCCTEMYQQIPDSNPAWIQRAAVGTLPLNMST